MANDISEASDFLDSQRQAGLGQAVTSADDDPEAAARAIQIGKASGVPPIVVHDDLEGYEAQHKAALTHDILRNNPYLQAYAAHDPMAAKVSSDDWGQLDTIHQSLDKLGPISVGQKMAEGFVSGVGPGGIGSWIKPEDVEKYPLGSIGYAILGAPVEVPLRLIGGIMEAGARGAGEMYSQVTGDREGGRRIGEDLLRVANDPFWIAMMHSMGTGGAESAKGQTAAKAFEVSRPYLEAGKEPPTGLHPLIDQMKQKQSELELKALEDLTKEAQKSTTRERAPEMFEKVIELKNQGVISISADAVAKLYGDKLPKPDDNVLGWIPDLEKQMYLALSSGGDIEVPIAKWATYVDPEIAKQLHDDIRPRKGGVTKAEGEVLKQQFMVEAYHGSPHEFDAFSMEKIGTGEGAQSYGHGLYFAENEGVARSYKDMEKRKLGWTSPDNAYEQAKEGSLYKVRIHADKEQFLDWDKPLPLEHPAREAAVKAMPKAGLFTFEPERSLRINDLDDVRGDPALSGQELYSSLSRRIGKGEYADKEASRILKEAGIPGIKYLDQGSRPPANLAQAKVELENMIKALKLAEDDASKGKLGADDQVAVLEEGIIERKELVKKYEKEQTYNFVLFDDSLIEITHKNEQAVANVRTAAKLDPLFEVPKEWDAIESGVEQPERKGEWLPLGKGLEQLLPEKWTEYEVAAARLVESEFEAFGAQKVELGFASNIRKAGGKEAGGVYTQYTKREPSIVLAVANHVDIPGVGRHEFIHHLRAYGFFTDTEWASLEKAAREEGWLDKQREGVGSSVGERYKSLNTELRLEEAIADEFRYWNRNPDHPTLAAKIFERLREFLQSLRAKWNELATKNPEVGKIFNMIESGEIGRREGTEPRHPSAFDQFSEGKQGELDVTRQEDKKLFATIATWMNKAQQAKYMDLIAQKNAGDAEFMFKKAERLERKRQSEEWKQNEAEMRPEVEKDVRNRPDMQALEFFRSGKLYGEETGTRPRVDPSKLTKEQRKAFPEKYQRRDGMNPSDVANLFGYTSFDELAAKLSQRDTELGSKTTAQFMKGIVDKELEQRMLAEYGDKEENILREAQEHVISPTQMDLLYEEVVALGMKQGSEMTFTKADFRSWVQDKFKDKKATSVSVEASLRDAGNAGRKIELGLLDKEPTEALKAKQQQLMSMMEADEAIKFEKDQGRLEKLAKRFSSREVTGVLPEYTNFVHDILQRIGEPVRRSVQDLAEAIGNSGFKDISHFVDSKEADLREVPVADFLLDPNFRKPLKDMTVDEYRAVLKSIQALVHNGRNELKIIREGEEADLQSVKDGMREQLETFPEKHIDVTGKPKQGFKHAMRTAWASLLQIEALFNRWDKGDRNGLFTKYISLPLADASNNFASLERKYGAKLRELKDKVDLSEGVDNTIFREPTAGGFGELMQFNRGNLRAILRYAGRPQAFEKLAKGYGLDPAQITDWLNQHATREDWDWASKQGKIFDEVFEEASKMYTRLTGVAPEKSEVAPVQTPFGTYDGWYHPIDYDSRFPGPSKKLMGGDSLEQKNYVRATTPAGYTKKVTGYNAPLSLDIANTAEHMRGMLHDIAYREAVIEASKIFYDHSFQRTVNKHYGLEYQKLLVPYLRDVANLANFRSDAQATGARVSEFLRQNIIGTLIGFNPGTVLKHGATAWINSMNEVGSLRFLEAVKDMFQRDEVTGDRNWSFALEHSEELQRRHRNYIDTMRGGEGEALGETSWRETMLRGGAWTVSKADLASAVPTWLAEYRHSMEEGSSHGEAISDGNRAVRRAHGSSVITNRPAAMRGGQAAQWMTSLYGFFSHMLNKQFEMMWRARETIGKFSEGEYQEAAKDLPQLSSMFFSYVIFPALIEELVTPLTNDEHESWAAWTGKTLAKGVSSSWPIIRDVAHAALSLHNTEPSVGLFTSSLKTAIDVTRDMKDTKRSFSKERAGKTLQHGITAFGALTGLTNQQEGRVANFMYNMSTGQEKPKGPWQFAVGMRFGQTEGHSKSFDDYMKSLVGNRR